MKIEFKFNKGSLLVIIISGGLLLVIAMIVSSKPKNNQPKQNIYGFFETREFIRGSGGVVLGEELRDQVLESPPEVEAGIILPIFPNISEESNKVFRNLRLGKTTRDELTDKYKESLIEVDEGYLYKSGGSLFQFNFDKEDRLKSMYFTNLADTGFSVGDVTNLLDKPEFIIKIAPFSPRYYEYIYPHKGITFFFESPDDPIKALVVYKPQTLEEYHKNYVKIFPFYYR